MNANSLAHPSVRRGGSEKKKVNNYKSRELFG